MPAVAGSLPSDTDVGIAPLAPHLWLCPVGETGDMPSARPAGLPVE